MVYDAWRVNGGPTQHDPNFTPVTVDVLEVGFIFAICVLGFCFTLIVPGYRGWSRAFLGCRVVLSLFILGAIFLGIFGQEWASAHLHTHTPYKAFSSKEIEAELGMKIGLASVNITLKAEPTEFESGVLETINYNERFHWTWRQGRLGFGPYSGTIQQEFRQAQFRGVPLPIQWIAEYFVLDGELIRWGRSFRTAGWYTWIVLWTAFPTWIIANILSITVLFYAGQMFFFTGGLMLVSVVIWSAIRYGSQPLIIPFENGNLEPQYGPSFWLVMSGGIVSCLYGLVIIIMYLYTPRMIADFFGNDILQDPEEFFHIEKEQEEKENGALNVNEEATRYSQNLGGVQKRVTRQTILGTLRATQRRKSRSSSRNGSVAVYNNSGFEGDETGSSQKNGMKENDEQTYINSIV